MGYAAGADAYRAAVADLDAHALSTHYTDGLRWFHDDFGPALLARIEALTGGEWDLSGWSVVGAGSDVDLITHVVEAASARGPVALYPGDWYGFLVGGTHDDAIGFTAAPASASPSTAAGDPAPPVELACLCVPSVRNGHLTQEMVSFLGEAPVRLLNLNLFPTLAADERRSVAAALRPLLPTSLVSISFSRGFGLTASQLGVMLVPPGHPWAERYRRQWDWFTNFHNAIAARAFMHIDLDALGRVDAERRAWTERWRSDLGLPPRSTGSYYVHAARFDGPLPAHLAPLARDGRLRFCAKPDPT